MRDGKLFNNRKYEEAYSDKPVSVKITKILKINRSTKSFFFNFGPKDGLNIIPGQFFMVWSPGVDEIPMSISHYDQGSEFGITVKNVGDATKSLHEMNVGDYIGIRGPYGSGYSIKKGFSIVIGGGVGAASVRKLIYDLKQHNPEDILVILGSQSEDELFYEKEFSKLLKENQFIICTDDGSIGYKGFTTTYLEDNLDFIIRKFGKSQDISVYTCGPEIMMKKIYEVCEKNKIYIQASLERMMRCGFGLCGLCVLDPIGVKVCQDGPVFDSSYLRKITDFGLFERTLSGEKIKS